MILKEVVIQGFKSFADRTKIELGSGVTTIVGPNGCGKSNVVDAIRWVLGEQSAKALRGGKMHDVIFAGTDSRSQGTECEVTLMFTDCEAELGTAYNEVSITRRVTRDGASQYRLNGTVCRLKDIQNLFMDTGVGRVSYSFMVQGQIDQILSNNPAERRVIFEEAAGITRYKTQRREALNKLGQVDQNLSRVSDVIEEVGRQMGSLKRQATKAIRFQRIKHRLNHLDLGYHAFHFTGKRKNLKELEVTAERLSDLVSKAQSSMASDESSLEEKKANRAELYERLQQFQQEVFDLRSQKDQLENQAQLASTRKKDTSDRISELEQEVQNITQAIADLASKAQDNEASKQMQLDILGNSDTTFQQRNEEVSGIQTELNEAEEALRGRKRKFLELEGEINRLRSKSTHLEVALKTDDAKVNDLQEKQTELEASKNALQERMETSQKAFDDQDSAVNAAVDAVAKAKELVETRIQEFRTLQEERQEKDRELARLNAQLSMLQDLQEKMEGFSDGAKAIMKGKLGEVSDNVKLMTQGISIDKAYTPALEALMGQAIDAVTVEEAGQIASFSEQLKDRDLGRACFAISIPNKGVKAPATTPDFLKPAQSMVSVKDKQLQAQWNQVLQGCYFTDNLSAFIEYWEANPGFEFLFVATQEGELIDSRGLVFGGATSSSKGASVIERDNEIAEKKVLADEKTTAFEALVKKVDAAKAALEDAENAITEKRADQSQIQQRMSELRVEVREANNAFVANEEAHRRAVEQLTKIRETHSASEESLNQAQETMNLLVEQVESLRSEVAQAEDGIEAKRQIRDEKREALSEIRIELAEKKQQLNLIDQGLTELEQRRSGLIRREEQRTQEYQRLKDHLVKLDEDAESCITQAKELEKGLEESNERLEKERKSLIAIEEAIKASEDGLSGRRKQLHELEVNLKKTEVALTKEQSEVNFLMEKAQTDYDTDLEAIDYRRMLWVADEEFETRVKLDDLEDADELVAKPKHERGEPTEEDLAGLEAPDWEALREEIDTLKSKVSSMGAVNLVAIDEYVELKERFEFLTQQCADLESSKEQLLTAIEDINETSQKLFTETFDKVKEHFKYTFETLFGGGHAELNLQESDDPLDAGIEIIARPPGTKLRSLSLLSGGQKTMTAVALLFAIYRVKPAPFCVLDELDAPLDDANIGRFVQMLKQFTEFSQFLVISHNKRTIAESDTLYGVTMQEKGVTKLISMRFNHQAVRSGEPGAEKLEKLVEA